MHVRIPETHSMGVLFELTVCVRILETHSMGVLFEPTVCVRIPEVLFEMSEVLFYL